MVLCLLNLVPVPHSCRGLLISESLNKETFIILYSELVWDYFIIIYNKTGAQRGASICLAYLLR